MAINHTDTETWSIEDIVSALSETPNKKKKINIPKFQRTLVWNQKQKKAFIDSIKQGFPVGAILLYRVNEKDGTIFFNLIDGLQRSTALNQYLKAPTQFFDIDDLPEKLINEAYDLIKKTTETNFTKLELTKSIVEWISSLQGFEEVQKFSAYELSKHIATTFKLKFDMDEVDLQQKLFVPFLAEIKDEANIDHFKIPILIYTGKNSNLPVIFERLNSKGTQLSKYQIYAATWIGHKHFKIDTREIIDGIKNKYDSLLDEGYEVENYDISRKFYTSEFSLFEYLFGFGKYLCNQYPHLFSGTSKIEQEDSIGFNVMNICLDLSVSRMDELPDKFQKFNVKELENAILDAINFVFECLKGYITLKMNSRTKIAIAHSELQIVSMIGKVFHSKYNKNLEEKETWKDVSKKLEENLAYHYLYDIIREYWRGSGDSKAYNLISNEKYETTLKKLQWENVLNDWFETDLQKREKVRVKFKEATILFYKYIYNHSLTAYEEISRINYDIEHLVPVDKLKSISGENGIPISAFPNICLLDEILNRKKGNLTFYQYFDAEVDAESLTESQSVLEINKIEKYTHTTREDLEFVIDDFNLEKYKYFLQIRFNKIKEEFFKLNKI